LFEDLGGDFGGASFPESYWMLEKVLEMVSKPYKILIAFRRMNDRNRFIFE